MTNTIKTLPYPLAFIAGILAYSAAGFANAILGLYRYFPYPQSNFDGPYYVWWAYDVSGFISVYYWTILYGILFFLFCFGIQVLIIYKQRVRQILYVAAAITILVTITIYFDLVLEQKIDPSYRFSLVRNILDFVTYALIGGWYVLGFYMVQRKQKG